MRSLSGDRRGDGGGAAGGWAQTLIDEGLLWPGDNVLSVDYKQTTTLATLTPEGRIFCHSAPPPPPPPGPCSWRHRRSTAPSCCKQRVNSGGGEVMRHTELWAVAAPLRCARRTCGLRALAGVWVPQTRIGSDAPAGPRSWGAGQVLRLAERLLDLPEETGEPRPEGGRRVEDRQVRQQARGPQHIS